MNKRIVSGERASTGAKGFNPSWQRHVSAYHLTAGFLPDGLVLDVGCGVGHTYEALAPRTSVGIDVSPEALSGQRRPTALGDLRRLPFRTASADGLISSHSIEHVPDPERGAAEFARVLTPSGVAVVITPNRLTFGKPDEIIDPYHFLEFDPIQFHDLFAPHFGEVTIYGVVGSARYQEIVAEEHRTLDRALALDRFRLRARVPRSVRQKAYDVALTFTRRHTDPRREQITRDDFSLRDVDLDLADDLVAVCRQPRAQLSGDTGARRT